MLIIELLKSRCIMAVTDKAITVGNPYGDAEKFVSFIQYNSKTAITIAGIYFSINAKIAGGCFFLNIANGTALSVNIRTAVDPIAIKTSVTGSLILIPLFYFYKTNLLQILMQKCQEQGQQLRHAVHSYILFEQELWTIHMLKIQLW